MQPPFGDPFLDGLFYDRYGNPISLGRVGILKWASTPRTDIIGLARHGDMDISTVWLGWAEGRDVQGRPLIFETAIWAGEDARVVGRYATEDEALAGHRTTLGALRINAPLPALPPSSIAGTLAQPQGL